MAFYYGATVVADGRLSMYEEILESSPFLRGLPRRELAYLGEVCREREYATGEELVRQGSGALGLIFLITGSARIMERQSDGTALDLGSCGVGATLGEWSMLEDQPHPYSVIALEPATVLVLPIWDFQATLREFPDIAIHLLAVLGRRLHANAVEDTAM